MLYTNLEQRRRSALDVTLNAVRMVRLVAGMQQHLIEEIQRFLIDLAESPEIRDQNPQTCSDRLARVLRYHPAYANLGAVDPEGNWFCSAFPLTQPTSVADRPWFRRVLGGRSFAVGEYRVDTGAKAATVQVGYPVIDDKGRIQAVLTVGQELTLLNELAAGEQLPEAMALLVLDRDGMVLARSPEPEKWVGRRLPEDAILQAMLAGREGVEEVTGADGIQRVYAFAPIRAGSQIAMYVSSSVPKAVAFAEVDRILRRDLIGMALVTVLALTAAWVGGSVFVLRRVRALVSATKRLAAGDLRARTGMSHGPGELSQLARAFDEMAASLEQGEAERQLAAERLRENAERLQALSRRLVEVQESERRQIARELHDEVGEVLTGLKLSLEVSARAASEQVACRLGEAQALVQDLMTRTRELSLDLRPEILDDLGLLPALLWHFERYTGQTGVGVIFEHSGLETRLPSDLETAAYRIVQEALTNVARHAKVNEVTVRLWADPERLDVQVEDRGTGFDLEAALGAHASSGVTGMRERAMLSGGDLKVESSPGKGTRVWAEFPLNRPLEREGGG